MAETGPSQLRIADLASRKPTRFALKPDAPARAALATSLNILEIRKLTLDGEIAPQGGRDWHLSGKLGATVVQACVVTLEPVVTRLDETFTRSYVSDFDVPDSGEVEMPEDDSVEAIPEILDLEALMAEALSLALPGFPRKDGAELGEAVYAQDGATPMTDDDAKPFAGLSALRDQLAKNGE